VAGIPLIGWIAVSAALAAWVLPLQRYQRCLAGLVPAAVGAGSLRAGLGTDRLDLLRPSTEGSWFLTVGVGLVVAGVAAAILSALAPIRIPTGREPAAAVRQRPADSAALLAGLTALLVPWVPAALGLAFLAGTMGLLSPGRSLRVRLVIGAGVVLLGVATWLLATIIGPLPSTYRSLHDGPIGDPAARLLVLLIGAATMLWLGHWPLLPAVAAVLGRVAGSLLPAGILLWQPLAMPLTLVLAGAGLVGRRPLMTAAALGSFGLWSATWPGWIGAGCFIAAALLAATVPIATALAPRAVWSLAGAGLMLIIAAGLTAEVAYTILLAGAAATVLFTRWRLDPEVASP
jgi:hypothetical protein